MFSEMMDIKCQDIGFVDTKEQALVVWTAINELFRMRGKGSSVLLGRRGNIVIRWMRYMVAYPYLPLGHEHCTTL